MTLARFFADPGGYGQSQTPPPRECGRRIRAAKFVGAHDEVAHVPPVGEIDLPRGEARAIVSDTFGGYPRRALKDPRIRRQRPRGRFVSMARPAFDPNTANGGKIQTVRGEYAHDG